MDLAIDQPALRGHAMRFIDLTGPKHRDSEVLALANLEPGATHVHNHSCYRGQFVNWIAQQRRRLRRHFGYKRLGALKFEVIYLGPKLPPNAFLGKGMS
jgi:hypothetical protein